MESEVVVLRRSSPGLINYHDEREEGVKSIIQDHPSDLDGVGGARRRM